MIPQETIDKIMDAAIIEDVIGEYVNLKKSGSNYKGLSPFTNEKTPSFMVSPSKGIFKCFSSGKGGNVVRFVMEQDKLSYPEALRFLAARYNIEIVEDKPTPEQLEAHTEKESLSVVMQYAEKYFHEQMFQSEEGVAIGLSYFKERGYREDTIKAFRLGYCHNKWDEFTQTALKSGYDIKYLLSAGLSKDKDGSYFDFYRGRVTFPIRNITGKTIGFGARTLRSDKKVAKYFNSPDNALYNKSNVLYGIYEAKNEIVKQDNCLLVEGYTDVISLHQSEVKNVVASSGTALTEGQIKLVRRYTKNITILYDGDTAGIKASFRGIDLILSQGMNVRVVLFPDGEDPDSYSNKVSTTELQAYIQHEAKDFIVFKTDLLSTETAGDPIKRAQLIREIVQSISLIPDAIQRNVYMQQCSQLLEVDEQVLLSELNKLLRTKIKKASGQPDLPPPPPEEFIQHQISDVKRGTQAQERDLLRLLLHFGAYPLKIEVIDPESEGNKKMTVSLAEFVLSELEEDEFKFENSVHETMRTEYLGFLNEQRFPTAHEFTNHSSLEVADLASALFTEPYELSDNWEVRHKIYPETEDMHLMKAARTCLNNLKMQHILFKMCELEERMKASDLEEGEIESLLMRHKALTEIKMKFTSISGSAVL